MNMWNPWHGCHKISEGCMNCYMFAFDKERDIDSNVVYKTNSFKLPISKDRNGEFKIKAGEHVSVCLTSDFFIEEADEWRTEAWKIIKERSDLKFSLFTKRVGRIKDCLPSDWDDGYDNVAINLTAENQKRIDERLPIFLCVPCKKRVVLVAPMTENVDIFKYLQDGGIHLVCCAGENYKNARPLYFEWVQNLCEQCKKANVSFEFYDTGENFYRNGKHYYIPHRLGKIQAQKAGLNFTAQKIDAD